ncbi:MAG: serine/threonine protein kinase [Xenococcaceae cyanobacterium]
MSNFPDFSSHGYQLIQQLGQNYQGGRATYKAIKLNNQQPVVIKQFQFAEADSHWSGYKAYEREIQVLRSLNHLGIPRYLDSFEAPGGFCMVQEYKDAQSLTIPRRWMPQQIKQIAISILEILVYLQNRIPSVIHRDIKPENILVDDQLNVYLVDFGFARIGDGEGAMSSVAAGTFGFMAPEQIYNRQLSKATDLYGLGATLICLLTGTKSTKMDSLIDDMGRINFKLSVSKFSLRFIEWLEKMVQSKQKDRYVSAAIAKEALSGISVIPVPEVHISQNSLQFKAAKLGEKITQTITVSNPIPRTVLKGRWEVAPHPNDPPHPPPAYHPWISFSQEEFKGNQVECSITVDTSNLIANKVYTREILLQTNSEPSTHKLTVEVHPGSIPLPTPSDSIATLLVSVLLIAIFGAPIVFWIIDFSGFFLELLLDNKFHWALIFALPTLIGTIFWFRVGSIIGFSKGFKFIGLTLPASWLFFGLSARLHWAISKAQYRLGFVVTTEHKLGFLTENLVFTLFSLIMMGGTFILLGSIFGFLVKEHRGAGCSNKFSVHISLLGTVLGIIIAMGLRTLLVGFREPFVMFPLAVISLLLLIAIIVYTVQQRKKLIAQYRQSEPHRIKP